MSSAGANTWSVPLLINNLESQISGAGGSGVQSVSVGNSNLTLSGTAQNPIISGTLTALTSNVATSNFALSGNTAGNPSFVVGGGEEFKVITTDLTPHILVSGGVSGGVQLGLPSGYGGYKVTAPTVVPSTTNDTQVATTAFVQSALASSGNVSSITAGTNISITGTANVPIINLQAPLTSVLNIGEQTISGASTVGDDTTSIAIVANAGVSVSSALDYSNPVSQQAGNTTSAITGGVASHSTSWTDTPLGTTHTYSCESSASDSVLAVQAIGTFQGTTATRTDFTNILGLLDTHSLVDTLNTTTATYTKTINASTIQENNQFTNTGTGVSNSISETINPSGIVCSKSLNNGGNVGNQTTTIQPSSSFKTQYATANSGTLITSIDEQCDTSKSRILVKNNDVSGANPILNQHDIYCSPVSTYYEQQSKNISGASKTTTLTTSATNGGSVLTTDGTLGITSTGNMNISSSSGVVLVESLSIQNNSITATPVNTDLDLITNGTGGVNITEAVASTNGALRITQQSAGGSANPTFKMINTDAGTGTVFVEMYKNKNVAQNDVIAQLSLNANDSTGTKRQFGAIECVATNVGAGNQDGALDFYTLVNGGVPSLVFRMNGADNENNSFRPLDLNGNALKTSSGNISIDASASSGAGTISAILKAGGNLIFTNLPTASAGLPAGAVWRNGTVLNIV